MFEKKEESAYLMYDRKKFLIDNINILEKIPVYNQNVKYILNMYNDRFNYTAPEVFDKLFIIVDKCIELSNMKVDPSEWIKEIKPFLDIL